jgi:lipopolysaccharide/colanic/teichoic acid biosynthesis glycosyltransferase
MAVIAIILRIANHGDVLLAWKARGSNGNVVTLIRFKLNVSPGWKARLGSFLEHTGLSDLPLLINVLRGDMSFFGYNCVEPVQAGEPTFDTGFTRSVARRKVMALTVLVRLLA